MIRGAAISCEFVRWLWATSDDNRSKTTNNDNVGEFSDLAYGRNMLCSFRNY